MIVAIVGTGTGVGKSTLTAAWARARPGTLAWKIIETGGDDDSRALAAACGRLIPPAYAFAPPISPHLAARRVGARIDRAVIVSRATLLRGDCSRLLLETAGGLFSPVNEEETNAELVAEVADRVVLVAPDRLGVLHDVEAVVRAWRRPIHALVLSSIGANDASVGTNAAELRLRTSIPVVELTRPSLEAGTLASLERAIA